MKIEDHIWAAIDGLPEDSSVTFTVSSLRAWLDDVSRDPAEHNEPGAAPASAVDWRERLWVVPAETRLGVTELCEALGRSRSWVYRHTGKCNPEDRMPHRLLEGSLVFVVGEVRTWVREHEEVIGALPMTTTDSERGAFRVVRGDAA